MMHKNKKLDSWASLKREVNNLGKRVITLEKGKLVRDEEKGRFIL